MSALVVVALVVGSGAPAAAQTPAVTLTVTPTVPTYGSPVSYSGVVTPAAAEPVQIVLEAAKEERTIAAGSSRSDGSFSLSATAREGGTVTARTAAERSAPVQLRVRPRLELRFSGSGVLGAPLRVAGRLTPPGAGRLSLTVGGEPRSITPDSSGAFSTRVSSRREGELCATLRLAPNDGFANAARRVCTAIETPVLRMGARGAAVRYLESALKQRAYALDGPPSTRYAADTRDAVYAFEKVEGLARDGAAGPQVWRRLLSARRPQPRHHGTHIEVDKTRQVLFEVRNGRVVRVIHVSTGATGNTPLGRFQVYRKDSGFNSLGMYDSLYFLRGFAIHGYASVPPYPASHGCVREPLWFAHGLYTRWSVGATIWIVA